MAAFAQLIRDSGVTRASAVADSVRQSCPEAVLFSEPRINAVGAEYRKAGSFTEAVDVLDLNARLFPESFLSHYWLAEALLEKGDTTRAIASYRRSVELDPQMSEAIQRLKELAP
jgi:tetratricopeptide (TPR) repeat protein